MTIPFTSIIFGDRARTNYENIEALAESIEDVGLQVPIILSPLPDGTFLLEDGGRRYRALETLGTKELHHATTSKVGCPGFVLKSEVSTNEGLWLTELIANMHRENMDWRDEVKLLVKAYNARSREVGATGQRLYYATFGKMVGNYSHSEINAAMNIHDELVASPEKFKDCKSLFGAYQILLKDSQKKVTEELSRRLTAAPLPVQAMQQLSQEEGMPDLPVSVERVTPTVQLSSRFLNCNSIDWMASGPVFDHIVCDPDFAVSVDRLSANSNSAKDGVIQSSVDDSLADLYLFLARAYTCVKPQGFLVFFYDLDHHEKLMSRALSVGWLVQRWPIIWQKPDFRSNGAPQHNFCKNIEYAMVCRKPSSTLASVQMSSVFSIPVGTTPKDFNHPFAKPVALWQKIYSAVATPGQSVFDPFMGSGSACVAAIRSGLESHGCELSPDHYANARLNITAEYRKALGDSVIFQ